MNVVQLKDDQLDSDEEYWLRTVDIPILRQIKRMSFTESLSGKSGYANKIASEEESIGAVTGNYLFDLSKMKVAVIVGPMPLPSELPAELSNYIFSTNEQA